jgi:hypothetical protein
LTTIVQQRVAKVLERIAELAKNDEDDADMLAESLEGMLEDIAQNDGFGTERQCDPRGDGRNGQWSMTRVEGVDTSK